MAEPFIGEIKMVGFPFPPKDWAQCDGQEIPMNQNPSLYALLGIVYGGDGTTTFKLPDYRGRVPIHPGSDGMGSYYQIGYFGGFENITLNPNELPQHSHTMQGTGALATDNSPGSNKDRVLAKTNNGTKIYSTDTSSIVPLSAASVSATGDNQSHPNMQPFQVINFVIALEGMFPPRN